MIEGMTVPPAPSTGQPQEVYVSFAGPIDQAAVQRILGGIAGAMQQQVGAMHLLFQSYGGVVGDGVCLYNYLHRCPIDLTLYNAGNVASIATIAFLGAAHRKVSRHATFMVHRTTMTPLPATARNMEVAARTALLDDARTEAILREHVALPDEHWSTLAHYDLVLSAQEAVDAGIADEIAEWSPPAGTQVYNL